MSIKISIGKEEYFPQIKRIKYEGPKSNNPLSFKYYDSEKIIAGKPMKDHFRFATAYWHTFCGTGADPFGPGTKIFPWDCTDNPIKNAKNRLDAAFEFFTKLGTNFYCFHDRDIAPEGKNLKESIQDLQNEMEKAASNLEFEEAARIRDEIKKLQQKELGLMAIPNTNFKTSSNYKKK